MSVWNIKEAKGGSQFFVLLQETRESIWVLSWLELGQEEEDEKEMEEEGEPEGEEEGEEKPWFKKKQKTVHWALPLESTATSGWTLHRTPPHPHSPTLRD